MWILLLFVKLMLKMHTKYFLFYFEGCQSINAKADSRHTLVSIGKTWDPEEN
jgi:hypothetical protein